MTLRVRAEQSAPRERPFLIQMDTHLAWVRGGLGGGCVGDLCFCVGRLKKSSQRPWWSWKATRVRKGRGGGAERGTRRRIGCASTRGAAWPAAGAHCAMRHTHGGALPKQLKCTVVMLEK